MTETIPADETTVEQAAAEVPAPTVTRRRRAPVGLIQTVGRRKEAVVRVRLVTGTGTIVCNGRPLADYFPSRVHQQLVKSPLVLTEQTETVDLHANLTGGGVTGQAGALRLGIARALNEIDSEVNRPTLKRSGMLTRDPRVKERRKAGLKKARKAPQYSKR